MKQFGSWLVLGEDGFDVDATVEAFKADLEKSIQTEGERMGRIAALVDAVLTEHRGVSTNLDFVSGEVSRRLNAGSESYAKDYTPTKLATQDYIRANACGEKNGAPVHHKSGEPLSAPKRFFLGKGPGAGVAFFADRVAAKAAKANG